MLNKIHFKLENLDNLKKKLRDRGSSLDVDEIYEKMREKNRILSEVEEKKNRKNIVSKEIGIKSREGAISKELLEEASLLSLEIKNQSEELESLDRVVNDLLLQVPNICEDEVPLGKGEENNIEIRKWGSIGLLDGLSHEELTEGIDSARAVKISGSRFVVLKDKAAELERELANFMLRSNKAKGYREISVPLLVKSEAMFNSGQFPKFKEDAYSTNDDLHLIPTSEVALVNLFSKELLEKNIYLTSFSNCFRRESGSYGKDTKGLIRLHQFPKVELVKIVKPSQSSRELELLVNDAEDILKLLEIPYRVVLKCVGDTSFTATKSYDLEVWMPSQKKYREISSCSNTKDFQSRRASIKILENGKKEYAHILNGSGVAVGRALAALIENSQKDGEIDLDLLISKVKNL